MHCLQCLNVPLVNMYILVVRRKIKWSDVLGVLGLFTNLLFAWACLTWIKINSYPHLNSIWQLGPICTHTDQLASYGILVTLFVISIILLYMIQDLRGDHKRALRTDKLLLSLSVIMFYGFAYTKWGHHVAYILLPVPIATFILHTTYQMDCIFAVLNAKPDKHPQLSSKWPAYLSICFNTTMLLYVAAVLTAYTHLSLLTTIGVFALVGCEILHRLLAIYTFVRLQVHNDKIASLYWLYSKEKDTEQSDKSEFVSQDTVPHIYRGSSFDIVTGHENYFQYLKNSE